MRCETAIDESPAAIFRICREQSVGSGQHCPHLRNQLVRMPLDEFPPLVGSEAPAEDLLRIPPVQCRAEVHCSLWSAVAVRRCQVTDPSGSRFERCEAAALRTTGRTTVVKENR